MNKLSRVKRLTVLFGAFLIMLLLITSVVACDELRAVPSDDSSIVVFQTGTPSILMLLYILVGLMGLAGLPSGIWLVWKVGRDFIKERNRLKNFWRPLLVLMVPLGAALCLYIPFGLPHMERLSIDQSSAVVKMERVYLLRDEILQFTFTDISSIKCVLGRKTWETGSPPYGKVMIILADGTEIEVSSDGQSYHYDLAEKISQLTRTQLSIEEK